MSKTPFQSVRVRVGKRLITFTVEHDGVDRIDDFVEDITGVHWIIVDFNPSDPADEIHPQIRIDDRLVKKLVPSKR